MPDIDYGASYWAGSETGYAAYGRNMWPEDSPFSFIAQTDTLIGRSLAKGFPIAGRSCLVLGCAFGFTLEAMLDAGVLAWGLDISAYAIGQADPAIASRVMVGDARDVEAIRAAKTMAGLKRNDRFDLILTEDLLPCLTDAEVQASAAMWRQHARQVMHRVSATDRGTYEGGYTLHTLAEWRALLGQQDWLYDYMLWTEG